jgi:orotate phosphoribosyltransferase
MTRTELAKAIYRTSHLTGNFVLRSGKISNEYFDKYLFESDPQLLSNIADHMLHLLPDNFDIIAGLEMGGIPLSTMISQKCKRPTIFVRKKAKEYGTRKLAEGIDFAGKNLVVVEDVITSGGQVIVSGNDLKQRGANIVRVICVIDRQSTGRRNLKENGFDLHSLFTMSEIKELNTKI